MALALSATAASASASPGKYRRACGAAALEHAQCFSIRLATAPAATRVAPAADTLDAAAVAWSAWRIATGEAVILPDQPQRDSQGQQIAIRY